jgi:peptide deformylase
MIKHYDTILQYPDPRLREKTKEVKSIDNEIVSLCKDLKKLAKENSKDGITLVGLAAPQLGAEKSVFIFLDLQTNEYVEAINPKVIYESKELSSEWEGCASVGKGPTGLFAPVPRSRMTQVKFLTISGEEKIISAKDFQSHIVLHEVDHLNGIIFLDRVTDPTMILTSKELDEYARKHGGKFPKTK